MSKDKPKKRQSAEISNLMSQLMENKKVFTEEVRLSKTDPGYGEPLKGTKTEARGRKAHDDISKEIIELCEVIWMHGQQTGRYDEDTTVILFGELFSLYNRISSKVVGLLLRARKYNLVYFEGETLFQGQNNETPIFLLRSMAEIRALFKSGQDPKTFKWGHVAVAPIEEEKGGVNPNQNQTKDTKLLKKKTKENKANEKSILISNFEEKLMNVEISAISENLEDHREKTSLVPIKDDAEGTPVPKPSEENINKDKQDIEDIQSRSPSLELEKFPFEQILGSTEESLEISNRDTESKDHEATIKYDKSVSKLCESDNNITLGNSEEDH
ncbi:uncharacterized protein LOC111711724 isoform X2 [Eurytemora carolleeae]|nr:uncharacterized protein LOC111711724 isoform X2 [Eurytemora carolleeae]|eukprot:XP_023341916.1 uncharacterized protein LOC111711724 isoform X2 [Eurytemora affinis]